jgi:hypothetical protein
MSTLRTTLVLPLVLLSACAFAQTKGNGVSQEQQREVGAFEQVHIASGLKATVKPGPASVRVSGDENVLPLIETEVEGGRLVARVKRGQNLRGGNVQLTITTPKVTAVSASGGGHLEAEASASERFSAKASGGSQVRVRGVDARQLQVESSGGSQVTLAGRADTVDVDASGGALVHARELEMATLTVDASGGTIVEAGPSKRLEADLSGGCEVRLTRNPAEREVDVSGGSEVVLAK